MYVNSSMENIYESEVMGLIFTMEPFSPKSKWIAVDRCIVASCGVGYNDNVQKLTFGSMCKAYAGI